MQPNPNEFTTPKKVILNIIKLVMIIPVFIYIARLDITNIGLSLLFAISIFFIIYSPLKTRFKNNN